MAGFSIWSRQQIYLFDIAKTACKNASWQPFSAQDMIKLRQLHKKLVPLFVQPMVPVDRKAENGLVAFSEKGELLAFAELYQGPKGIWTQPYISPEADIPVLLSQLCAAIPNPNRFPIYLCTRSYQPLIADAANKLGLTHTGAQNLMVKHLVLRNKVEQSSLQKIFESGSIEGSFPSHKSKQIALNKSLNLISFIKRVTPYLLFGIRRFNITSKQTHCNSLNSLSSYFVPAFFEITLIIHIFVTTHSYRFSTPNFCNPIAF